MKIAMVEPMTDEEMVFFKCPGCRDYHVVPTKGPKAWVFNGDFDFPTLAPSILARSGFSLCHVVVTSGQLQFLGDCTHNLKNSTVEMVEVPV